MFFIQDGQLLLFELNTMMKILLPKPNPPLEITYTHYLGMKTRVVSGFH